MAASLRGAAAVSDPLLGAIEAAADNKARAAVKASAIRDAVIASWPSNGPLALSRDVGQLGTVSIVFDARPVLIRDPLGNVIGVDALIRVFRNAVELRVDPHRIFVNPPIRVPDATQPDGYRVDLVEAFVTMLVESLRTTPNPRGWRTAGTVTTVYAGTADGRIRSSDPTYATAADGGTFNVATANTGGSMAGQDSGSNVPGSYSVFEGFYPFDTSGISDAEAVSDVTFSLVGSQDSSTTDFVINVAAYDFGATVTSADWRTRAQLNALPLCATYSTSSGWSLVAYNAFTSRATFRGQVNVKGTTYLIVFSDRHAAGTTPTGDEYVGAVFADNGGTTSDPKLVVTSGAPGIPPFSRPWRIWRRQK